MYCSNHSSKSPFAKYRGAIEPEGGESSIKSARSVV